jgi:hypothetical protein
MRNNMSGIGLSVADIQRWSAESVRAVFHAAQERGQASFDAAKGLRDLQVFATWGGDSASAAKHAIGETRKDLDAHGDEAMAVAHAAKVAADGIEAVQQKLRTLIAEAEAHGLTVNPVTSQVEFGDKVQDPTEALLYMLDLQPKLDTILREADGIDDTLATAINMADGDAPIPVIPGPAQNADTRLQNQIDAFKQVFGRPPTSATDWETAAALDPHSYDPKNGGVPPNIVVGRINPVPGQGLVRANLFIPSKSVLDPTLKWPPQFDNNAGDDRGFSAGAGPESSRVSLYVDYENGVVVARQNPSVDLTTGQVKSGTPDIKVAQRTDGSVYIGYAAADPFSPGGESLAKQTVAVKGQVVVQPGGAAPRIGGVVSSFPALEVYGDRPTVGGVPSTATTTVAQMWPAIDNQWGPIRGLIGQTRVGDQNLLSHFAEGSPGLPLLLPTTDLGPASQPPTVVVVR